jgi:hypothetical protein
MYKNIEQYTVTQPSLGPDITIGNFDAPPDYSAAVDFVDTPPGMSPEQRKNPSTRQLQCIQGQDNVPAQHPKQRIVCNESPHCGNPGLDYTCYGNPCLGVSNLRR